MIDETLLDAEDRMEKAVDAARGEFGNIRSGRANAAMFTSILVDYYGAPTPLQQLATIAIPEARTVLITPFDRSATASIDKALRESDLGVNPTDDGRVIRVVLPVLTEERRRDYVKLAKSKAEESRVSVRGVRRKAKEALDRIKRDGEAGEDDVKRAEDRLDKLAKRYVDQVDKLLDAKEKELLEV
ncbi:MULTISPECIES: ribosome recycling factor [Actinomycetaceae]|jgi:ribosome recycling factor|uniref:ribosome recycling factor n=1 Tax=Actinomycetaceae TaxID=2049 RepID=UPI0003986F8C|nr:ribosome recycling factor [Actinobaculum sp. oral taxon 183]ERH17199.1 ribosome recycling factor [Actinobaculum sp. oral taxon 183 str. F0552]RKV69021.1 MAG: ribosome recycling factor [Actinomyces sp.]